jgi:hypothetical protein
MSSFRCGAVCLPALPTMDASTCNASSRTDRLLSSMRRLKYHSQLGSSSTLASAVLSASSSVSDLRALSLVLVSRLVRRLRHCVISGLSEDASGPDALAPKPRPGVCAGVPNLYRSNASIAPSVEHVSLPIVG